MQRCSEIRRLKILVTQDTDPKLKSKSTESTEENHGLVLKWFVMIPDLISVEHACLK